MVFQEMLLGKRERLSWVDETSYGIGGTMTGGEIVGLDATIEPGFNQNWEEILSAGADNRYVQGRVPGPLLLPFTLTFTPVNWKFLKYAGYSVANGGGPPYAHTFTISNSVQSFKLEWAMRHTTPIVVTLTGCTVKKTTIKFQKAAGEGKEGFVKVVLDCVAQNYSFGSSVTTLSSITAAPFQWRHTKWTVNTAEVVEINNGTVVIDQSIDEADCRYCNSTLDRTIGEPIPKTHRITGVFNVNFKDNTFFAYWNAATAIGGTNKAEFIRGSNDNVSAVFSNLRLGESYPSTDLEGVSNKDIPFTAESFSSLISTDANATY
jgi:hypothetical protein